jgi:pimeloyl-ACP methyl ester carboxylesterase
MSTYVLVHGAWHGSWCWNKVIPLLQEEGHKVITPDLPGHGSDRTPISTVSLQAYTDCVCHILDEQSEPVILVGHSMGGVVISQAAECRPEKINTLVYLAAYLLRNGESVYQVAEADQQSLIIPNAIPSADQSSATLKDEAVREVFYGDCTDEDVTLAKSSLIPQAVAPLVTPLSTTEGNFGKVRRVYVSCLRDRAVTPSCQEKMYTSLPCDKVVCMDTCHSPFLSAPQELAKILLSL